MALNSQAKQSKAKDLNSSKCSMVSHIYKTICFFQSTRSTLRLAWLVLPSDNWYLSETKSVLLLECLIYVQIVHCTLYSTTNIYIMIHYICHSFHAWYLLALASWRDADKTDLIKTDIYIYTICMAENEVSLGRMQYRNYICKITSINLVFADFTSM